jgi:hypothetical protein
MKFIVKVCDRSVLLDEAQLATFVDLIGSAEVVNFNEYVGHNKGTHGKNMEYTNTVKTQGVHEWMDLRPMDMNLYNTIKLVQKLDD